MSIDVNYYSFSPSRADKEWPHFIEDLSALRQKHSTWDDHEKESTTLREKKEKIEDLYEPRVNKVRNDIFNFFDAKEYVIPWIEWDSQEGIDKFGELITMTDEDKMAYLKVYGCVYQRGTDLKEKNKSYLMLRRDAPELEESYDKMINERDSEIQQLIKQAPLTSCVDRNIVFSKRQEELDNNTGLDYLVYDHIFNNEQLLSDLKNLDLYYGSMSNDYFESPKVEYIFLEALISVFNLKTQDDLPTREEWIRLFEKVSGETIQELSAYLVSALDWDKEESEWAILDYLRSVRPIAKDLKDNPDAIFIRFYGGEIAVEPKSNEENLLKRAKKHKIEYKEKLLPVL